MKPLPYDKVKQLIPGESTVKNETSNSTFNLEERVGSFLVSGIQHRGQIFNWEVKTDELLGEKEPKTLDGWITHNDTARQTKEYGVLSAPQYHSLFSTLYEHRNDKLHKDAIDQLRTKLAAKLTNRWICTMSTVNYAPHGQDTVTHNLGMTDEYTGQYDVMGEDGFVTTLKDGSTYCEAIVGDARVTKVNKIYKWLNGKKAYAYRVNQKPKQDYERVVSLGGFNRSGFILYAYGNIDNIRSALGVREVRP